MWACTVALRELQGPAVLRLWMGRRCFGSVGLVTLGRRAHQAECQRSGAAVNLWQYEEDAALAQQNRALPGPHATPTPQAVDLTVVLLKRGCGRPHS